jgi:hypothetical protein
LETAVDVGGKDFVQLVRTSGLEEKTTASNLTLFVPSDDAVRDFTDSLQEAVSILSVMQTPHQYKIGHYVFLSSCMLLFLCRFLFRKTYDVYIFNLEGFFNSECLCGFVNKTGFVFFLLIHKCLYKSL